MREYSYYADLSPKTRALNLVRRIFQVPVLERWLRKRTSDAPVGSWPTLLMPPEYLYPKGSVRRLERDGLKYVLDISNATDHGAYFNIADDGDLRLMQEVRPTHTVVDIGGNIGIRAMAFAQAARQGKVISLEPDPVNFARLQEHVRVNGLSNVVPVNAGIGPKAVTEKLYRVVESNSGMNRILHEAEGTERFPFTEVRLLPLMDVLQEQKVDHVDVIKIDVEGFEAEVLKGCAAVLERDHPVLFIELDDDNLRDNGSSATELLQYCRALGYDVFDAITSAPISADTELAHCHFDIICRYAK